MRKGKDKRELLDKVYKSMIEIESHLKMTSSTIVLFLLCLACSVHAELSKDFKSMIFYLTDRHPNDYDPYGCW